MHIAIISDSHDNIPNIDTALAFLKKRNIATMIHCGDVCAPSVLKHFAQHFSGDIHLAYGNVDGDQEKMEDFAVELSNLKIHGEKGKIEIDGKTLGFNHYPDIAERMAESGEFDVVFYGHDHKAWEKTIGKTVLYNPGTLAGLFAKPTFAIYDTRTGKAELILVETIQ